MQVDTKFQTKNGFAFSALRDTIINGELRPGDWIRVEEWAKRLRVSQTPIREALRRLEAQGLVEIEPHRGARVTARTREHLIENYLIRAALESLAARLAVEWATDEDFSKLRERVEVLTADMEGAVLARDLARFREVNREIHMAIYRAAGLPRLLTLIETIWATYPFDTLHLLPGRSQQALQEHRRLLAALRSRDAQRVAEAMQEHLGSAQQVLLEAELVSKPAV